MKTNQEPRSRAGALHFFGRFLRAPLHQVFHEEADERRFLAGLPLAVFVALFLIRTLIHRGFSREWAPFLNPADWVLVVFTLWWIAYLLKFRKRLESRGELGRAIIVPALFLVLLLSVRLY